MPKQKEGPKDWRKCEACSCVRREIYAVLGPKGELDALTKSRVDEYIDYWVLRHQLQDDIEARGLYVQDDRGRIMENRSVSLSIQASRQMAAIAQSLGLMVGMDRQLEDEDL